MARGSINAKMLLSKSKVKKCMMSDKEENNTSERMNKIKEMKKIKRLRRRKQRVARSDPPKDPARYSENWKKMKELIVEQKAEGKVNNSRKSSLAKGKNSVQEKHKQKVAKAGEKLEKRSIIPKVKVSFVKPSTHTGETKAVAIDCEMVGVGEGGVDNNLARVSLVNQFGHCLLDEYVLPIEEVTDYRTSVSGITPALLADAVSFWDVQKRVAKIIESKLLVGHALHNDLQVLYLDHPRRMIRDTAKYKPFKKLHGSRPSLKKLTLNILGCSIQSGEHNSVEDAQAAMRLYMMHRKEWERSLKSKQKTKTPSSQKIGPSYLSVDTV